MGSAAVPVDARHRTAGAPADTSKRRSHRGSDFKEADKFVSILIPERSSTCKLRSLKVVLIIIICGSFLMLLHSPAIHHYEHSSHSSSLSRLVNVGRMGERSKPNLQYESPLDVGWIQILKATEKLDGRNGSMKVGLLNFNVTEINHWQQLLPDAEFSVIRLDHAQRNLTWDDLYPEWIDEEEESEVPSCPKLPEPKVQKGLKFDLVAAKLPCNRSANWSRDVARLHLQLAAAKVAAKSGGGHHPVHVLLVTNCFPIPNLFMCKNRVTREGNAWLYRPDLRVLKEKLRLPVGSCTLAVPLEPKEQSHSDANSDGPRREAYATVLHSELEYVCGAIAAAQSIRLTGSKRDLVILVDETITDHYRSGLAAAGWKVRTIQRIRNPKAEPESYNEWNYSKFRLWQLTDYDKIIFIDADLLILRNIDFLFTMPEITAIGNNGTLFNSGVMVIEPSNCTFQLLMDHIDEIESYNGGDQGYLNEIYTWWHRIPQHMNFLKHFWEGDEEEIKEMKTRLFGAEPPVIYVLHYLGLKPWQCFRDYDCNWNLDIMQEFASDVAHARWWKVHDTMPEYLQSFCLLSTKRKASLEWDRRLAKKANYSDVHWRRKISDPRRHICFEEYCYWESMLWHWGDPNYDDNPSTSKATAKQRSM
ncbi:putative UDP-glucuronate:xylan alpha-glucuronosyltransferase 3 [Phoenix dactylifera]|uniref:Hexosyltransferase n=1 Tax=Phoenix dactylifera TaxID=42345 RepID=A0A8B7BVY5_PHODC|nr:putative UDP-glucuronate:xylan alpha-glucuronosyltransferase 3 [Phoenix dactylifera]